MPLLTRVARFLPILLAFVCGLPTRADIPASVKPVSLGLGSYNYYSNGPFADTALTGANWIEYDTDWGSAVYFYNTDGALNPQFNARGLPNYLNPGKKLRLLLWPYSVNRPPGAPDTWPDRGNLGVGRWVITWQGEADIRLNGATFVSTGSSGPATGTLVNGRRIYTMGTNTSGHITVEAVNPANPVTDLKAWLPDPADPQNLSLEGSASLWHPTFLASIASTDFNHLRFMDWGDTNASPQKDWSDRRLPERVFQHGKLHRRDPSEGAVSWYNNGVPVYFSGDRNTGIAYEYMVNLANTTNKDLWLCIPHLATDEFVTKLAQLIAFGSDGTQPYTSPQADPVYPPLAAHLKLWLEYSNEIWSNGDSFPQGNWAQLQATGLSLSKARFNARRFAAVWSRFQSVFGGSSRIVRCAAIWTGSDSYTNDFLNELHTYGPTLSPAVTPDVIAPTTYFGNGIQDWTYEQANLTRGTTQAWFHTAADFIHNVGTGATRPVSVPLSDPYWTSPALAQQQTLTFKEWKKRIFSGSTAAGGGPDSTGVGGGFSSSLYTSIHTLFGQHLPIVAYEGGPSLYSDYVDGADVRDDGLTDFNNALNRHPAFAEIYRIQLNMARAKGLTAHSMFTDLSMWSKYGQWGHLEYPDQAPTASVKWAAVHAWAGDAATLRSLDQPLGTRPTFTTPGTLPIGLYNTPYSQDIGVSGGEGAPVFTLIGSLLASGLSLAPVPGEPTLYRLSGTPVEGGWNYLYLRVQDADGDASWQVFSLYIAGGPGTILEADTRGTFSGASSLPWTQTHTLDPAVTWSGLNRGAVNVPGGGTATGTDGTGVQLYSATDALRFSVSQGSATEADSTLASSLTDNEYWTFTITPQPGQPLDLRQARMILPWRRETYHAPRRFAVFTSVGGFASGQQLYTSAQTTDEATPLDTTFTLPDTAAYADLTAPIEFRIYFYGSQYAHQASLLGVKLTRPPTTYATWLTGHPTLTGNDALDTADPDSDGIANFLEYALNSDPSAPNPPTSTFILNSETKLQLRFLRARPELTYTVQASSNLVTWDDLVTNPGTISSGTPVTVTDSVTPSSSPRRFLRLNVSE